MLRRSALTLILFLLQAVKSSEIGMPMPDEHYILDDNKYVADILQDFKAAKGRDYQSKILFKKRMFRETDETITEPQFVTLSYVQVRHMPLPLWMYHLSGDCAWRSRSFRIHYALWAHKCSEQSAKVCGS